MAPVVEELVVVLFEFHAARFHLGEDARGPEEVGEFFAAFGARRVGAGEEFELRGAGPFRDAKLEGRAGLDDAAVAERAEEMFEVGLGLAFLVACECRGELREFGEAGFEFVGRGEHRRWVAGAARLGERRGGD